MTDRVRDTYKYKPKMERAMLLHFIYEKVRLKGQCYYNSFRKLDSHVQRSKSHANCTEHVINVNIHSSLLSYFLHYQAVFWLELNNSNFHCRHTTAIPRINSRKKKTTKKII